MPTVPIVRLVGQIEDVLADTVIGLLKLLAQRNPRSITLLMDSRGGDMKASACLARAIQELAVPVEGVVLGRAHSGCFLVLQRCAWRSAVPNATFLFHAPSYYREENDGICSAGARRASIDYLLELEQVSVRTGCSVQQWRHWAQEQHLFTATEALRVGAIDAITFLPL